MPFQGKGSISFDCAIAVPFQGAPWYGNVMIAQTNSLDQQELRCAQIKDLMHVRRHQAALVRWYDILTPARSDLLAKTGCKHMKWGVTRGQRPQYQLVPLADLRNRMYVAPDFEVGKQLAMCNAA